VWVIIALVIFVSILAGTLGGILLILILKCLLNVWDVDSTFLKIYPAMTPMAKLIFGAWITMVATVLFSKIRRHEIFKS
jgi:hypothetical protein